MNLNAPKETKGIVVFVMVCFLFSFSKIEWRYGQVSEHHREKIAISVEEMGELLGIGRSGAYQLARSEGFPAFKLGKRVIVYADGLKEWVAKQTTAAGRK